MCGNDGRCDDMAVYSGAGTPISDGNGVGDTHHGVPGGVSIDRHPRHRIFTFSFQCNEKGAKGIVNPHPHVIHAVAHPTDQYITIDIS